MKERESSNYELVFKKLDEFKKDGYYKVLENATIQVKELKDPIDTLREFVLDKQECYCSTYTTT